MRGRFFLLLFLVILTPAHSWAEEFGTRRTHLDEEMRYGGYTLRVYQDLVPDKDGPTNFGETLVVFRDGKEVYDFSDFRLEMRPKYVLSSHLWKPQEIIPLGTDITGDGQPNALIATYSGGAHCCYGYLILELGSEFREVTYFESRDFPVRFVDLDGEPGLEIVVWEGIFTYWKVSFAASPAPLVFMKFRDGAYWPAPELMRAPPLTRAELLRLARQIDVSEENPLWTPRLWGVMLNLIYSGNANQARDFFDLAWPPAAPGKEAFYDEFLNCQLRWSRYWSAIAEMNGFDPTAEPVGDCPGPQ